MVKMSENSNHLTRLLMEISPRYLPEDKLRFFADGGGRGPAFTDWLVIGSGFGGSVSALRLAEKGYTVGVLEAGRRFRDEDFAKTTWPFCPIRE
jgi:hypothetical protein